MFKPTLRFIGRSCAILSYSGRSNHCWFGHWCSAWSSSFIVAMSAVVCRSASCWIDVDCCECDWLGCLSIFCWVWLHCWSCDCCIALDGSQSTIEASRGRLGCQGVLSCTTIIVHWIAGWIWSIVLCVVSCCIQRRSLWHTDHLCIGYIIHNQWKQY